jgi:Methylase involved in ubiquinone/menaquinone biosynthesis
MVQRPNIDKSVITSHYATREKHDKRKKIRKVLNPPFEIHEEALQSLNLAGDESILDVGCGDGEILLGLSKSHQGRLVGLDLNPGMFQEALQLQSQRLSAHPVEFIEGSAEALPFEPGSFDLITAFFMLYHLPDLERALSEFQRVLKENGRLLVTAMGGLTPFNPNIQYQLDPSSVVVENVEEKLAKFFRLERKYVYRGSAEIKDAGSFLEALDSMRDFFVPAPDDEAWKLFLNAQRDRVEKKIKLEGSIQDRVVLGYFIFSKN